MPNELISGKARITTRTHRPGGAPIGGVYGLVDPAEPDVVRYVGSSQNMVKRVFDHTAALPSSQLDGPKRAWLQALKETGRRPEMVVLQELKTGKATPETHRAERAWIEKFRAIGQADLNATLAPASHEVLVLRERVKTCTQEIARLSAELSATRNELATLQHRSRCEDPQLATQHNAGLGPVVLLQEIGGLNHKKAVDSANFADLA